MRRRVIAAVVAITALGLAGVVLYPMLHHAVKEITLPLRHEDIIRQQAARKHLDPALIAAVIYAESKFNARDSSTGAKGLMQIQPDTARFIARRSGGTASAMIAGPAACTPAEATPCTKRKATSRIGLEMPADA